MRIHGFVRLVTATMISTLICAAQLRPPLLPPSSATRILEQGTWGPNAASIEELQRIGFEQWFQDQVGAPITIYPNQPMLGADGKPFLSIGPLQVQFFQNALNGPDQLRQRVAFALSEIWVVSRIGVVTRAAYFPPLLNIFQRDAFAPYSQLMRDVTLNPAMGAYLDMLNNSKATATSSPNENYGRELMQLFTLGLNNLRMDGTPVLDKDKNPVPTYTPATVTAMSAALTGWVYAPTAAGAVPPNVLDPMVPDEYRHDTTEKKLPFIYPDGNTVTITLPANRPAETDLDGALNAIYRHPSLAPFVSKQLIQHLVTSNPTPDYVQRVAEVFSATGGNLEAVVKAILTDREARAGDSGSIDEWHFAGHFREPILLTENLLRGLNGSVSDSSKVYNYTSTLGQGFLEEPSVFSYFSPQFQAENGLLAPELQLHTTQTAVSRANQIYRAIYFGELDPGTKFDISEFVTAADSAADLERLIAERFFHSMMPDSVTQAISTALRGASSPTQRARAALYIALTSSEFQVIH